MRRSNLVFHSAEIRDCFVASLLSMNPTGIVTFKHVILGNAKDLLFNGRKSRSFALLRMTWGSGRKSACGSWHVSSIGSAGTGSSQ